MVATRSRLAGLVLLVVCLVALQHQVALADPGFSFVDEFIYEDVHPCTGETRTVDSVYTVTVHEHPNNTVLVIEMYSVASDGTVERGHQVLVESPRAGLLRVHFATNNVDGEGNRFIGHLRATLDRSSGELTEHRSYTCTGAPA